MSENNPGSLTPEEQATLSTGKNFWSTSGIERAGINAMILTDGPHGLRLQAGSADHLGLADSVPATCFPPAVTLGSSFDVELAGRIGSAIGNEARAHGVGVVLGPGINIKRSPLCGRNFEYFSEDPLVSGALGAALVNGLQSQEVGGSIKHFAVNNQEHDRMRVSAEVAARPLREIYLRGFERVVRTASPWTVMCSYNKINGVPAAENSWLLNDVLRTEWGFDGVVVSDWGAVDDRVRSLNGGLDLEMPGNAGHSVPRVLEALESGELSAETLATITARVANLAAKTNPVPSTDPVDFDAHHELAREAAGRGVVLLKNEKSLLPLTAGMRIGVIGEFAQTPRYQGAGSSLVNPTKTENLLDELRAIHGAELVDYAPGYGLGVKAEPSAELTAEALRVAAAADTVVLMLGLPASAESEGFDRTHISLPQAQLTLLEELRAIAPNLIVVLVGGSVVELPFADDVSTIVAAWLGGQASGGGLADVLTGQVNPSGRLAETIPHRLADTPAALDFPGEHGFVTYGEGIYVGYRWYDAREMSVRYPFGHGLSYTDFEYSNLRLTQDGENLRATLTVKNIGDVDGRDVIQLYLGKSDSTVSRPPLSLGGFAIAELAAGEQAEVEVLVESSEIAYWDVRVDRWVIESGAYEVSVGSSSRDIRLSESISLAGNAPHIPITTDSTLSEVLSNPIAAEALKDALEAFLPDPSEATDGTDEDSMSVLTASFPIGRLPNFPDVHFTRAQLNELIATLDAAK